MISQVPPSYVPARRLAVGKAPSRAAKPTTLIVNVLIAIEARDLPHAALCEGFGQHAFGRLVTASGARKDRNRRNPVRQIILAATLDPKHRAGPRHPLQRCWALKTLV